MPEQMLLKQKAVILFPPNTIRKMGKHSQNWLQVATQIQVIDIDLEHSTIIGLLLDTRREEGGVDNRAPII